MTKDVSTSILAGMVDEDRYPPGRVRDAILDVLSSSPAALPVNEIERKVRDVIGPTPSSSIRSYLRLNTPDLFHRENRGLYRLKIAKMPEVIDARACVVQWEAPACFGQAKLYHGDCFPWLKCQDSNSIHAVVTDPPYGLHEYAPEQQLKLRNGKGGVWRIPPSFDGHTRSPLPRFTTLKEKQLAELREFFFEWGKFLLPKLPLVSYIVSGALAEAGLERRGEIIRLVMTMRGGDRPKAAHEEFREVSMMPRSMWEPWLVYRKAIEGRAQDNLRTWKTGGFRRPSQERPFGDVIKSSPTRKAERSLAPHPSLKPQAFLRQLVRGVLPLGEGVILYPFAGAGSTLAAAEAVGYPSIGVEKDEHYFKMACKAIAKLARYRPNGDG